jgi:hypothetical protein
VGVPLRASPCVAASRCSPGRLLRAGSPILLSSLCALAFAARPPRPATKPDQAAKQVPLGKKEQIDLIRGLSSEIAVAKVALPRGKHGIYLDDKGHIDQAKAQEELRLNGPAVNAGTPVKITKIDFKGDQLIFEINDGGKSGKHWYQHIEIGMGDGTMMAPIAPTQSNDQTLSYGSYITLKFPGRVPNLTAGQAKQLLSATLDFTRHSPTVLYSQAVPVKFKEAIKNHEVVTGMNRDAVLSAKGPPDRKVREEQPDGGEKEDWIYGLPPHVLFVTFDGDTVVRVHQY